MRIADVVGQHFLFAQGLNVQFKVTVERSYFSFDMKNCPAALSLAKKKLAYFNQRQMADRYREKKRQKEPARTKAFQSMPVTEMNSFLANSKVLEIEQKFYQNEKTMPTL